VIQLALSMVGETCNHDTYPFFYFFIFFYFYL
jgi:hypothetical protein